VRFLYKERRLFEQAAKEPWLSRGIGIKVGEVVAFGPARATGGIERLLALAAWGECGEDVRTAASRAGSRKQLGIAKGKGRSYAVSAVVEGVVDGLRDGISHFRTYRP